MKNKQLLEHAGHNVEINDYIKTVKGKNYQFAVLECTNCKKELLRCE